MTKIEVDLHDIELKKMILDLPYNSHSEVMVFIPKSDYGFAEIYRIHEDILVFLIPEYGGTPALIYTIMNHSIDNMIDKLRSIT